ncbi:radical SAM protein [Candidatus Woesearchaeota archaeon]|nr:radical SAM protein [Candidatus Woesearchaeota archaeon]
MSYLKNLLQIYNISKSIFLKRPRIVLVDLTYKCNADCIFCHADKNKKSVLSLEQWKHLLNQIKNWLGTVFIDFSCGEPLLNKDCLEILKYSNNIGLVTSLSTNASLITKKIANQLMSINLDKIIISFYGTEKTQNSLMQRHNYKKIVSGVRNLLISREKLSSKTKIFARIIIHNKNLSEINQIISFIKKESFDGVIFRPLTYNVNLMKRYDNYDLWIKNKKLLLKCLNKIKKLKRSGFNVINSYNNLNFIFDYYFSDLGLKISGKGNCFLPFKRLTILCNGDVKTCCFNLGNINSANLKDLYTSKLSKLKEDSKICTRVGLIGSAEKTSIKEKLVKAYEMLFN